MVALEKKTTASTKTKTLSKKVTTNTATKKATTTSKPRKTSKKVTKASPRKPVTTKKTTSGATKQSKSTKTKKQSTSQRTSSSKTKATKSPSDVMSESSRAVKKTAMQLSAGDVSKTVTDNALPADSGKSVASHVAVYTIPGVKFNPLSNNQQGGVRLGRVKKKRRVKKTIDTSLMDYQAFRTRPTATEHKKVNKQKSVWPFPVKHRENTQTLDEQMQALFYLTPNDD